MYGKYGSLFSLKRRSLTIALDFYIWEHVRLALKGFFKTASY